MPAVENDLPTLLSFKPYKPGGKRVELVPGVPVEMSCEDLESLWAKDPVFRAYYKDHGIHVDGWSPDDGTSQSRKPPESMLNPHAAVPNLEMRPAEDKPEPGPEPSTDPIDPIPNAGVPGNTWQAKASIESSVNPDQLNEWKTVEKRKTVLGFLKKRIKQLSSSRAMDDGPSYESAETSSEEENQGI